MGLLELVRERHLDTNLGKLMRKSVKEIATYYKQTHLGLMQMRAAGHTGRLEFVGYA